MPFPINISTPRAAKNRSPRQTVAHELVMAELEADAALHGIAPGHQDEANRHASEQRDHPGRPIEHESPEWLNDRPRRWRRLDADALQCLAQRLAQYDRVRPCAGLYPCEHVRHHARSR